MMADKSKGVNDRQNLIEFAAFIKSRGLDEVVLANLDGDDGYVEKMILSFLEADEQQRAARR